MYWNAVSGTKCPQTLPLRHGLLLCKSQFVKKPFINYCPTRLTRPTGLTHNPATVSLPRPVEIQLTLTLPVTYGNLR